jgi:hypothetical protein
MKMPQIHRESRRQVIPDQYVDKGKLEDLLENLFPTTKDGKEYNTKVSRSLSLLEPRC